jgi:hypothetical protein
MTKRLHGRTAAETLDACCNHLRAAHIDAELAAELMGNAARAVRLAAVIEAAEEYAHRLHLFAQADEQSRRNMSAPSKE